MDGIKKIFFYKTYTTTYPYDGIEISDEPSFFVSKNSNVSPTIRGYRFI